MSTVDNSLGCRQLSKLLKLFWIVTSALFQLIKRAHMNASCLPSKPKHKYCKYRGSYRTWLSGKPFATLCSLFTDWKLSILAERRPRPPRLHQALHLMRLLPHAEYHHHQWVVCTLQFNVLLLIMCSMFGMARSSQNLSDFAQVDALHLLELSFSSLLIIQWAHCCAVSTTILSGCCKLICNSLTNSPRGELL